MGTTDNMTKEERVEYWELVMSEYEESGLTKKDYCDANGINISTFHYWQNRLDELNNADKSERFVELKVPSDAPKTMSFTESDSTFAPELGIDYAGLRILVSSNTPMALLNAVLSEVGYA